MVRIYIYSMYCGPRHIITLVSKDRYIPPLRSCGTHALADGEGLTRTHDVIILILDRPGCVTT